MASSLSMITTLTTNVEANNDNDECSERGATSTTAAATTVPVLPGLEMVACLPELIRSTSYSSSLSSLSPSVTPSLSGPLVSNSVSVGVVGDVNVDVAAAADTDIHGTRPQVKERIRELKTRFLRIRDELESIIGRLEVLEGGEEDGDDLGQGGGVVDGGGSSDLVSQAAQTGKRKDKESDLLDIEMIGVSVSGGGAIPGYVDAAVGVDADALVWIRDVSCCCCCYHPLTSNGRPLERDEEEEEFEEFKEKETCYILP
jgi:hypothetical protein